MATVQCWNCKTLSDPEQTGGWCDECGKKLPGNYQHLRRSARPHEEATSSYDADQLPPPLGDPLRIIRFLLGVGFAFAALFLVLWSALLFLMSGEVFFLIIPLFGLILGFLFFFAFWRILPNRRTNAFYLRSFTNDKATLPIRQEILRGLGAGFRLSGIRDPRRRWPAVIRYLDSTLFAIRYCSPRYMNLEAGKEWKARLWRSLGDARCALIDISQVTSFVAEEIELCFRCLGLDQILFIAHTEQERDAFLAHNRFPAWEQGRIQVAVWSQGRRAFREQVRAFAKCLPLDPAGLQREALPLTRSATLPDGPSKSREGSGWTEALLGTLLGGGLWFLLPDALILPGRVLFFLPWLFFLFRYVIEVGNSLERYKTIAWFVLVFLLNIGMVGMVQATQKVRESAARAHSLNNLKQLALAMHDYSDHNSQFPAAAIYSRDGRPLLSWRVAILPYIEQQALYNQFKLDEPWDSPHNIKLLPLMPRIYAPVAGTTEPNSSLSYSTFYRVYTWILAPRREPGYPPSQTPPSTGCSPAATPLSQVPFPLACPPTSLTEHRIRSWSSRRARRFPGPSRTSWSTIRLVRCHPSAGCSRTDSTWRWPMGRCSSWSGRSARRRCEPPSRQPEATTSGRTGSPRMIEVASSPSAERE